MCLLTTLVSQAPYLEATVEFDDPRTVGLAQYVPLGLDVCGLLEGDDVRLVEDLHGVQRLRVRLLHENDLAEGAHADRLHVCEHGFVELLTRRAKVLGLLVREYPPHLLLHLLVEVCADHVELKLQCRQSICK